MASSSSSSSSSSSTSTPRTWKYRVFTSFHGPDVRTTFLSHLRKEFSCKGITMFDDQGMERGQTIAHSLTQAIRESRISIILLSKNYASSSWCLDELLEILKCRDYMDQIVTTIFYGVDPSDVRKQDGKFGKAFKETCFRKTEEEKQRWSQALNIVGNIAGVHSQNWNNEAKMIEEIAKDVLNKLNITPSRDFDGIVGLETHLKNMESLLDLDYSGVKIVAIFGPAGIGKTTIARALHSILSNRFQLTCFVDNLRGNYPSGFDEYGLKLRLQEQFLSNVLNQNGMKISNLGAIKQNLYDQKVLIILDDVNNLKQLEALANETTWFGPGSRIIVTTENKELLQQHEIRNTYQVGFPSSDKALEILCSYAFRQSTPRHGFEELAKRITELCGNLPLGLRVVGSSLRGKKEEEWEDVMRSLETNIDRDIADVLRVGYESLDENEKTIFLHIAVFFNYEDGELVKDMFFDTTVDVKRGLKRLLNKSLINKRYLTEDIVMHKLLQQVARQAIQKQDSWERQLLMDSNEICDVLESETGSRRNVFGISFDISKISEVSINRSAFKRLPNLRFLKVYGNNKIYIPEVVEFPHRLRYLDWKAYPSKCLPPSFHPENLVKLSMQESQLEKLWEGTQPLKNLKYMYLSFSRHLKELPDLSNATNLEILTMYGCESLVEIPSSCSQLYKLRSLCLSFCINLEVIKANLKVTSLERVEMIGCSKLRNIPFMSEYIKSLDIRRCTKLRSLPELSGSLGYLSADGCSSLETIFFTLTTSSMMSFANCYKLGQQARAIIQKSCVDGSVVLPGMEIPSEFVYRSKGNFLTFPHYGFTRFKFCLVVSPNLQILQHLGHPRINHTDILCRRIFNIYLGHVDHKFSIYHDLSEFRVEHLVMFYLDVQHFDPSEMSRDIIFEFSNAQHHLTITDCGVQILNGESIQESYESGLEQVLEQDTDFQLRGRNEDDNVDCWTWIFSCFNLSNITKKIGRLGWEKKKVEAENTSIL